MSVVEVLVGRVHGCNYLAESSQSSISKSVRSEIR